MSTAIASVRARMAAGSCLLGAHRGNSDEFPENTLRAFQSAIELGVDMIECDIHLTADQQLAVIHDHLLERTSDGRGLVRDQTLAELKTLDAGSWKDARFRGERIPELSEVLQLARGNVGVAVEVKNLPLHYEGIERRLVDLLQREGMVEQVIVIAFDHRILRRLHDLDPQVFTGVLEWARPVDILGVLAAARADAYCPHWASIDPPTARELAQAGKLIGVWTVDDPLALEWAKALPANAIYTNKPRLIRP